MVKCGVCKEDVWKKLIDKIYHIFGLKKTRIVCEDCFKLCEICYARKLKKKKKEKPKPKKSLLSALIFAIKHFKEYNKGDKK